MCSSLVTRRGSTWILIIGGEFVFAKKGEASSNLSILKIIWIIYCWSSDYPQMEIED